jgi:hypothetical protein
VLPTLGKTLRPVRRKNLPAEIRLFEGIWADENFVISTRKLKNLKFFTDFQYWYGCKNFRHILMKWSQDRVESHT